MAVLCGVDSVPFTVLIDTEGKVVDINIYGKDLESKIAELLGTPVNPTFPDTKEQVPNAGKATPDKKDSKGDAKAGSGEAKQGPADDNKKASNDASKKEDAKK